MAPRRQGPAARIATRAWQEARRLATRAFVAAPRLDAASVDDAEDELEVAALGERQRPRVIDRLSAQLEDPQAAAELAGRLAQGVEQRRLADVAGARAGDQEPAGARHLERGRVQPGVGRDGLGDSIGAVGERRRVADDEVVEAFVSLSRTEGIIPALESAHALAWVIRERERLESCTVLVNLSGRGDKDADFVAQHLGLTLAMGAFIAGMILSESDYQHQISLDILPVKDYFSSIFFISVGMLLNLNIFWQDAGVYLLATVLLIALKGGLAAAAVWVARFPLKVAVICGLYLAQTGEFSLILSGLARQSGVLNETHYQGFLIVALLSMLAAPPLIQWANPLLNRWFKERATGAPPESEHTKQLENHVVIAGYGMIGRHLSGVLHEIRIPFIVIERDGEKMKKAMMHQAPVLYGDSTHRDTLKKARLESARMLVVSLPDLKTMQQVVRLARMMNPDLYILVRTSSDSHVETLTQAGANLVIPEEFETSIEIFTRVLREYRIPGNVIEQQIELVRMEGYSMFRGISLNAESLNKFSTYLTATLTESVPLEAADWATGKTVEAMDLKNTTGARLIAVVRKGDVHANPEPGFDLREADLLVVFGRHAMLNKAITRIRKGEETPAPPGNPG